MKLVERFILQNAVQARLGVRDLALADQAARAAEALCPRASSISPWKSPNAVKAIREACLIVTGCGLPHTVTVRSMASTPLSSA